MNEPLGSLISCHLRPRVVLLAAALWLVSSALLHAHPHVWVDGGYQFVFDDKARLTALRHAWTFDSEFSAYASQGLDKDGDGTLSREELQPLAQTNAESLAEFDYFTFGKLGDKPISFADPKDYYLSSDDGRLTLFMTLPLREPLDLGNGEARFQIYDETYFVDFALRKAELPDAFKEKCEASTLAPVPLGERTLQELSKIGQAEQLPEQYAGIGETLSQVTTLVCAKA